MANEKNNLVVTLTAIAAVFAGISAIASPFVTQAVAQEKIHSIEKKNVEQDQKLKEAGDMAYEGKIILPRLEARMDKMDAKLEKIYQAVKS